MLCLSSIHIRVYLYITNRYKNFTCKRSNKLNCLYYFASQIWNASSIKFFVIVINSPIQSNIFISINHKLHRMTSTKHQYRNSYQIPSQRSVGTKLFNFQKLRTIYPSSLVVKRTIEKDQPQQINLHMRQQILNSHRKSPTTSPKGYSVDKWQLRYTTPDKEIIYNKFRSTQSLNRLPMLRQQIMKKQIQKTMRLHEQQILLQRKQRIMQLNQTIRTKKMKGSDLCLKIPGKKIILLSQPLTDRIPMISFPKNQVKRKNVNQIMKPQRWDYTPDLFEQYHL